MKNKLFFVGGCSFLISLITVRMIYGIADISLKLSFVISVCFAVLMGIIIYKAISTDNSYDVLEEIIEKEKKEAFGEDFPKEGIVRKYLYKEPSNECPDVSFIMEVECKNNKGEPYMLSFDISFEEVNYYVPGTVIELNRSECKWFLCKINKLVE